LAVQQHRGQIAGLIYLDAAYRYAYDVRVAQGMGIHVLIERLLWRGESIGISGTQQRHGRSCTRSARPLVPPGGRRAAFGLSYLEGMASAPLSVLKCRGKMR